MAPPASILIPTRRRRDYLAVALASAAPQAEEHGAELIVVEDDPEDAESKPVAIAKPPAVKSSGTDLTIPLLLLFAAVSGFFAVRAAVRSQRS